MGLATDFAEAREALKAGDDGKLQTFYEKYRRVKQDQGGKFANETYDEFKTRIMKKYNITAKKIDDDDCEDEGASYPYSISGISEEDD
ncbi:MAG: hypothetical protein V1867_01845 [Candidatus Falkowbacteria bacterium]